MENDNVIKILLLTDFASGYSRDLLRGLVRYAKNRKGWTFYRMPMYYKMMHGDKEIIRWAKKWKVNAIVAQINDIDVKALAKMNIPIIVQNYKDRIPGVCNLTGDYMGTGVMAADYFIGLGYKSFAYYGIRESVWSRERFTGYENRLAESGFSVDAYFEKSGRSDNWAQDFEEIGQWLLSLPKNTAVFCCDDHYALHITETCRVFEIPVPDSLAVLGVDNDDMICNISHPTLSSIVINAQDGGYMAGKAIDELISMKVSDAANIILPPLQVITRGSTNKYAAQDKYVLRAIAYIEKNYADLISVNDLLALVPLSRRVFERRFKQETGTTIYQFLQNYRVGKFAALLLESDRSVEDIAISCGFTDTRNVSRVFYAHKNMTPTEFRKKCR